MREKTKASFDTKPLIKYNNKIMGERNKQTKAIILTIKPQGENNRSVQILSPERGVFYATLYGGPKSKMRSLVQPFHSGTLYFYEDEAKHAIKITDFDVKNVHPTFRTNLYKMWAANLAAELMLKTKCAGENEASFTLLSALTDGMDLCEESGARLGMLRFLWRYMGLLGVQPDTRECSLCGKNLNLSEENAFLTPLSQALVCSECLPSGDGMKNTIYTLNRECRLYLQAINEQKPSYVRSLVLKADSVWQMKSFLYHLTQEAAGSKLLSMESGSGIL